jgi:hypothetical protein
MERYGHSQAGLNHMLRSAPLVGSADLSRVRCRAVSEPHATSTMSLLLVWRQRISWSLSP